MKINEKHETDKITYPDYILQTKYSLLNLGFYNFNNVAFLFVEKLKKKSNWKRVD